MDRDRGLPVGGTAVVRDAGTSHRKEPPPVVEDGERLVAAVRAPAMWGSVAIFSVGLAEVVPGAFLAIAAGLALAGLPALHRAHPALAAGAAIVLGSGYGLAASGLVLAGLLGLVVASLSVSIRRSTRPVGAAGAGGGRQLG